MPSPRRTLSLRDAAAAAAVLSMLACNAREAPVTQTTPAPATASAPPTGLDPAPVVPAPEQLVRSYQGQVEDRNGKRWVFLQINHVSASDAGITFRYTLNEPNRREDESGEMERDGRVRLHSLAGHARVEGADVILESEGIDGPPYWRVVGHPPETASR